MPVYQYKAIDRTGQSVQGRIEAESYEAANKLLVEQGRFGSELTVLYGSTEDDKREKNKPVIKVSKNLKLSERERCELLRQIATALQGQLPIVTALQVVGQQNPSWRIKQLMSELIEFIKSGESLSYAFSHYPRIFERLHLSLVAVGETSGKLDKSMGQLADLTERDLETRNEILTASMYPAFVLCLGLISTAIVVTWILPQILSTLIVDIEMLPWPTRVILAISNFFKSNYGIVTVAVLIVVVIALSYLRRMEVVRYLWDGVKLRIPVFRIVLAKWAISRFARTLGTLTASGVNIIDSLLIVRNAIGNEVLARDVERVTSRVRSGSGLAVSLKESGRFPPLLIQIVSMGEETGELSELLLNAAQAFDRDTQQAVRRFMAVFPAVLITLLAAIIGFIVAATLLPIVQIQTAIPGL